MGKGTVLLCFPEDVQAACVEMVTGTAAGRTVVACPYSEPSALRVARGSGATGAVSGANALSAAQRDAFAKAEVVLTLDLPIGVGAIASNLRWVQVIGAGVDHLAGSALGDGVVVTNAAGVASAPIAEFVMSRVLAVLKRHDEITAAQQAKRWAPLYGRDVMGLTIGIIGFGQIGQEVARRARAFGMRVIAVRAHPQPSDLADTVTGPDRFLQVLPECDVVVVSAPATPATAGLFDESSFRAMREGAIFCNVSRGSLVNEDALVAAVDAERLSAAVLDVTREEPLPADSPLWEQPRIHISAHCAPTQEHYVENVYRLFVDNLQRYDNGAALHNVVGGAGR